MPRKRVKFYFYYDSPYAYFAERRIRDLLDPYDVAIDRKPKSRIDSTIEPVRSVEREAGLSATDDSFDFGSPRFQYVMEDVTRHAQEYGLRLNHLPKFLDVHKANLGFFYADEHGCAEPYNLAIYGAAWLRGKDIANEAALLDAAREVGLDVAGFRAALTDPRYAECQAAADAEAKADGAFGVPFFVFEGKHFWGNDRLEWLVKEVARHR
jgi:2-hydroxychromene-2-carboxylate isomerase